MDTRRLPKAHRQELAFCSILFFPLALSELPLTLKKEEGSTHPLSHTEEAPGDSVSASKQPLILSTLPSPRVLLPPFALSPTLKEQITRLPLRLTFSGETVADGLRQLC